MYKLSQHNYSVGGWVSQIDGRDGRDKLRNYGMQGGNKLGAHMSRNKTVIDKKKSYLLFSPRALRCRQMVISVLHAS